METSQKIRLRLSKVILLMVVLYIFVMLITGCNYKEHTEEHITETTEIIKIEKVEETKIAENSSETTETIEATETSTAEEIVEPINQVEETIKETVELIKGAVDKTTEKNTITYSDEYSNLVNLGKFALTAYCSCEKCCGEYALNRPVDENGDEIVYGSIGVRLIAGISIAVDPHVIPYGSEVIINGHTYVAHDTGGAIKGNRIDVYFDNHQEALDFGMRYAEVYLVKN